VSTRRPTPLSFAPLIVVLGLLLTACGSDDSSTDTASEPEATASSTPSGGPGGPGGGFDQEQLDAIRACLEAAGLEDSFPTDLPSGQPSDFPTDRPSDLPSDLPSDMPSDMPSDFPSEGAGGSLGGGPFDALNDPEVQAALQACGIELPTGRPSAPASS
jgi:PT repeat